jgi:hypothetical protein
MGGMAAQLRASEGSRRSMLNRRTFSEIGPAYDDTVLQK